MTRASVPSQRSLSQFGPIPIRFLPMAKVPTKAEQARGISYRPSRTLDWTSHVWSLSDLHSRLTDWGLSHEEKELKQSLKTVFASIHNVNTLYGWTAEDLEEYGAMYDTGDYTAMNAKLREDFPKAITRLSLCEELGTSTSDDFLRRHLKSFQFDLEPDPAQYFMIRHIVDLVTSINHGMPTVALHPRHIAPYHYDLSKHAFHDAVLVPILQEATRLSGRTSGLASGGSSCGEASLSDSEWKTMVCGAVKNVTAASRWLRQNFSISVCPTADHSLVEQVPNELTVDTLK